MIKRLSILSVLFLIGLFVIAAAPTQAANTDARIKALEEELNQLKVDQQEVKQGQLQMQDDALAARAKKGKFSASHRQGRGATFKWGGKGSGEYRIGFKTQAVMSFFPDSKLTNSQSEDDKGPAQASMIFRHLEIPQYFKVHDGLYEMGFTFRGDTSRSSQTKSEKVIINLSKFSPYYPDVRILALSPNTYSPQGRVSSGSGYAMERAPVFNGILTTGSSKGLGLQWSKVPVANGTGNFTLNLLTGNQSWNNKIARDPTDQKGVMVGFSAAPWSKTKGMGILKGLSGGFSYLNTHEELARDTGGQIGISTRGRINEVDIFAAKLNGRMTYMNPWLEWKQGPLSLSASYDQMDGDRNNLGTSDVNDPDVRVSSIIVGGGAYIWGPKGFMTGSKKGGLRFTYTHARSSFDHGVVTDNDADFNDMKAWNYNENIFMLRWFHKPNISYALEYQHNNINQMRGSGDAADARRDLGVGVDGGTYQIVTINTVWSF